MIVLSDYDMMVSYSEFFQAEGDFSIHTNGIVFKLTGAEKHLRMHNLIGI